MNRYLCQLCNRIVTYGEKHPCFLHQNDDNVYSLLEPDDFGRTDTKNDDKLLPNSNENFVKSFPDAHRNNIDELGQSSTWLVGTNREVSLNCFSDNISLKELPSETLFSGSSSNIHSRTMPSKESQFANFLHSSESFEPASRSQVDIRRASKRKSRPNRSLFEINEAVENDSNSFYAESSKICKTLSFESKCNKFTNAKTCFSPNSERNSKQANMNSNIICEALNFYEDVALLPRIEETNEILTAVSRDSTDVPIFPEMSLHVRNGSNFLTVNVKSTPNSMEDANIVARPIVIKQLTDPKKGKSNKDLSAKEFDFKSKHDNHSCGVCKKVFSQKSYLKVHYKIHTVKKLFVCDICKKEFNRKGNLKMHYKIHTGEKPFVCDICKKEFIQKGSLKMHYKIHTGEKPFVCDICKREFIQKQNLKNHKRTHSR